MIEWDVAIVSVRTAFLRMCAGYRCWWHGQPMDPLEAEAVETSVCRRCKTVVWIVPSVLVNVASDRSTEPVLLHWDLSEVRLPRLYDVRRIRSPD